MGRNYSAMEAFIKYAADLFCTCEIARHTRTLFHFAVLNKNWKMVNDWLFVFADKIDVDN